MSESSSGPPNPRQARYREVQLHWSGTPITIFLIVACCAVALVSKLGSDTSPVLWMFLGDVPDQEELIRLYDQLDAMDVSDDSNIGEYNRLVERIDSVGNKHSG